MKRERKNKEQRTNVVDREFILDPVSSQLKLVHQSHDKESVDAVNDRGSVTKKEIFSFSISFLDSKEGVKGKQTQDRATDDLTWKKDGVHLFPMQTSCIHSMHAKRPDQRHGSFIV